MHWNENSNLLGALAYPLLFCILKIGKSSWFMVFYYQSHRYNLLSFATYENQAIVLPRNGKGMQLNHPLCLIICHKFVQIMENIFVYLSEEIYSWYFSPSVIFKLQAYYSPKPW